MNINEVRAIVESLQVTPAQRQADEFTVVEAAEVWGITPRAAVLRLDKLERAGEVVRRAGRSQKNRPVTYYRKVTCKSEQRRNRKRVVTET